MAKQPLQKHAFSISIKNSQDEKQPIAAYVYDKEGEFLAAAPVKKSKAKFEFSGPAKGLRLAIGPAYSKDQRAEPPSIGALERLDAFFPKWQFKPGVDMFDIDPIPDFFWPHWLLCRCQVRGRVVKRTYSEGGVVHEAPVCNARVHICEVDPIFWLITRLPELEIFRLRDDILDLIRKPLRPLPIPDPDPGPVIFDPRINFDPRRNLRRKAPSLFGRSDLDKVAFNPQPEPPRVKLDRNAMLDRTALIDRDSLRKIDNPAIESVLPSEFKLGMSSHSALSLRQTLLDNLKIIRPWICYWPWLRHWYHRCDELRVIQTNDDGEFETSIWYPCNGDKPDLYFWVEYSINGVWTTVHRPPMPCNVWWNYPCGTEVTLTVTDPRVPGCGSKPDIPGKQVVVKTIGRNVSMGEINRDTSPHEGTVKPAGGVFHDTRESPLGGILEPRVDFGNGLKPAGITHYRWSYRELDSTDDWIVIDEPINRHYRAQTAPGDPVIYKYEPISTGSGDDYFVEIEPALPADGDEWEILNESYDLKSAAWDTRLLAPGKYELKLELFKGAGGAPVDFTADGVGLSEIEDPAPLVEGTYTTSLAEDDRVIEVGSNIMAYRLVTHVDNRQCSGTIESVTILPAEGNADTPCGFIEYQPGASVTLNFRASHPANYARFDFNVSRVATHLPSASAAGLVDAAVDGFSLSGDLFSKNISVSVLFNEGLSDDETPCIRAAFGEHLDVIALATDGYSRLSGLDAPRLDLGEIDLRAFALTPVET